MRNFKKLVAGLIAMLSLLIMKPITANVREAVQKATEVVLEETKDVDVSKIIGILESEYKIRFFNVEVLEQLIKEALNNIVFIYC